MDGHNDQLFRDGIKQWDRLQVLREDVARFWPLSDVAGTVNPLGLTEEEGKELLRAELKKNPKFNQKDADKFLKSKDPKIDRDIGRSWFSHITGSRKRGRRSRFDIKPLSD